MKKIRIGLVLVAFLSILACDITPVNPSSKSTMLSSLGYLSSYPASGNLRISLTDAPSKELKNVFVNVDHAELFVQNGSGEARLIVAQNLGLIDLLTLRNGVLLPMQDLSLPVGVSINAIRLVLKGNDNHSIKKDNSRCEMQTPSGQQSGIKIHLSEPFTIEQGRVYSMVMDFDAEKSVIIKGNGDCLLKPVLKLLRVTQIVTEPPPSNEDNDDSNGTETEGTVTDQEDTNTDDSGFEEPTDEATEPPAIIIDEVYDYFD